MPGKKFLTRSCATFSSHVVDTTLQRPISSAHYSLVNCSFAADVNILHLGQLKLKCVRQSNKARWSAVSLNYGWVGWFIAGWIILFIHPSDCFISPVSTCSHSQRTKGDRPSSNAICQTVCKSASAPTINANPGDDRVHYAN